MPFVRVRSTSEIVRGTLAGEGLVAEALEVRASLGRRPEVDLTALIENKHLVEELVDTLAGLVAAE